MKTRLFPFALGLFALGVVWQTAGADGKHHSTRPDCEPGYQIVEEIVMQDVVRHVCKMVPEYKKKWVYSAIDDPFCVHNTKHGECPHCTGPYCRKQLVKRQVLVPCPTTKCVVETIVERVPVKVYRKVPCPPPAALPRP